MNIPNEPWCYGLSLLLAALPGAAGGSSSVIDLLNHMGYSESAEEGYSESAEEASRVLPDPLDLKQLKQLEEFGDQHGISRSELVSRMGGSP